MHISFYLNEERNPPPLPCLVKKSCKQHQVHEWVTVHGCCRPPKPHFKTNIGIATLLVQLLMGKYV